MKSVYLIDGNNFSSLSGFFKEFGRVVLNGVEWGENFDAFDDVLYGGFNAPESGFVLRWLNSKKSKIDLSRNTINNKTAWVILMNIFNDHSEVEIELL